MPEPADLNLDELKRRGRRRLIGAIVLALAAAVLVPMLLESEPKPLGDEVSVKIPPIDEGKFVNRLTDSKAKAAAAKAEAAKAEASRVEAAKAEAAKAEAPKTESGIAEAPKVDAATPAPAKDSTPSASTLPPQKKSIAEAEQRVLAPSAKASSPPARPPEAKSPASETPKAAPAVAAAPSPAATPASVPAAAASPTPAANGNFVVQLGSFADDKGANAHTNRLKKAGYTAYTEPYATSRGTLWRVRIGPFPTRDAALGTLEKLKGEGQSGIVMSK